MNNKKFLAALLALSAFAAATAGCGKKDESSSEASVGEPVPVESSAEETTEELIPPEPVEANDPNAVTFDNDDFSFAGVICDDDYAADGTLSISEWEGNKMLKFSDSKANPLEGRVQKISISAAPLIGQENLGKVRSIEFDLYADATDSLLKTDDAENVKAPGWIGGGGGTVTAKDGKWFDFKEFSGGEYNFEMSGACHAEFKFLAADGGMCWSNDMEDANFLIMRWGMKNESDIYIDNIVFYDADGKSIPLAEK